MISIPPVDLHLARLLERAEAAANAAFVEARARVDPGVGAEWVDVAGAFAMFDGVGSPLTQTFGVGLFDPFLAPEFDRVEEFFTSRGSATSHEVSSFAAEATQQLLPARGYARTEYSTVLVRPTAIEPSERVAALHVREIAGTEGDRWAHLAARGWASEGEGFGDFVERLSRVTAQTVGVHCFIAEAEGEPVATGTLHLQTGIALLAGASTIPSARGRGAQTALLQARLDYAAARGAALAMIVTQPESGSLRNSERRGFRQVYSRTKWERPT